MQIVEAGIDQLDLLVMFLKEMYKITDKEDTVTPEEVIRLLSLPEDSRPINFFAVEEKPVGLIRISFEDNACLINSIIVLKENRKRGIGTELLKYVEKQTLSKGMNRIWAYSAVAFNVKDFYEKNGFIQEGGLQKRLGKDHYVFGKTVF